MKIIKIPKPIQLRCKHSPSFTSRTHNALKLNTNIHSKPPLPQLNSGQNLYNSKNKHSSINLRITTRSNEKHLLSSSTHKFFLPTLSKSTSPNHNNQPHLTSNHSTLQHKKTNIKPRQVHSITLPGLDYENIPKQNQDNHIILKNIFKNIHYDIIGVLDGHGKYGHFVSEFLKNEIQHYFTNELIFTNKNSKSILSKLINNNFALLRTFNSYLQNELEISDIDIEFSGSTFILLILIQNNIIISNTGDSRAIIVSRALHGNTCINQLSTDHKPDIPYEKERILKHKGEIFKENEDEPYRVWCKGKEYPGIAMSRSLGDTIAKEIGVCYEPEIRLRKVNKDNMYIIVASDGVWDVLSNKTVEEIVTPFYYKDDIKGACNELLKQAEIQYRNQYENGRDDITLVIYFFPKRTIKLAIQSSTVLKTISSTNKLL